MFAPFGVGLFIAEFRSTVSFTKADSIHPMDAHGSSPLQKGINRRRLKYRERTTRRKHLSIGEQIVFVVKPNKCLTALQKVRQIHSLNT